MDKTVSILGLLKSSIETLLSRIHVPQKSTISAYKFYEKKARRDFKRTNGVSLGKNERLTPAALLCLKNCRTIDEAMQMLNNGTSPRTYIVRLAYVWNYYENVDVN